MKTQANTFSVRSTVFFIVMCAIAAGTVDAQTPKGSLVIIGGGKRGPEIMNTFVQLAGGKASSIAIFPMASELAESMGAEQTEFLQKYGAGTILYLNIKREQANSDSVLRLLDGVTGVFFSGGDQSKLTRVLKDTRTEAKLHQLYQDGAVLGGTSAGAAVMSKMMLTGAERFNKDSARGYTMIRKDNIITAEGFGFIDEAIVDQHFIKRNRHNRLLTLVLEHPGLVGIGIDESTAIVVHPDKSFDVVGDATVIVYDATQADHITTDKNNNLAGANLRMHILKSGDRFDWKSKKPIFQ